MNTFEKPVSQRSEFMYRYSDDLPDGVNEDSLTKTGALRGSKNYLKGYKEEGRSGRNSKAQSFYGDRSIFGAKTQKGVKYFAQEILSSGGRDELEGYVLKLKIGNKKQIHPHEQYPKVTDDKKYDPLIKATQKILVENDKNVRKLAENQRKAFTRIFVRGYSKAMSGNDEIVVDAGDKGVEIVEIKPVTIKQDIALASKIVQNSLVWSEEKRKGFKEVEKLPPKNPSRMQQAKETVKEKAKQAAKTTKQTMAKMSPFRRK